MNKKVKPCLGMAISCVMAMVCKKFTNASFVISTGTNLESMRFRSKVAQTLGVPVSQVSGWIGGEHGDAAIPLWSTTKVSGLPVEEYASKLDIP
jgi:malate dehydrogenase